MSFLTKIRWILIPIICICLTLSPLFEMKALFSLSLVALVVNNVLAVKKMTMGLLLGILFIFSYIYAPYWLALVDPNQKYFVLLLLSLTAVFWAYGSASNVAIGKISLPVIPLSVLSILVYMINSKPLGIDLAWRGDEDFHILLLLNLIDHIHLVWGSILPYIRSVSGVCILIAFALTVYFLWVFHKKTKKSFITKIILIFGSVIVAVCPALVLFNRGIPFGFNVDALSLWSVLRYPFIQKWISIFFLFPNLHNDIRLYRMVPFLSTILLAWYLFTQFEKKLNNHVLSIVLSFSFVTIPLVYFFSTILYLEMPIVLLMTYCVFHTKDLLYSNTKTIMSSPIWYALLLLSFLKETVLILLIVLLAMRFVVQIFSNKLKVFTVLSEIKMYILVLIPVLTYLLFRMYFLKFRPYIPQADILFHWSTYQVVAQAMIDQIGPLFFVAIAGCVMLFRNKEKKILVALLTLFVCIILFFIIDGPVTLGYARWNLYSIPILFYLAYRFFTSAKGLLLIIPLIMVIVGNVLLNPIFPDGVRKSNWGSPNTDGAEYYYPYDSAMHYLSSLGTIRSVMILGNYYPYWGIRFYEEKYQYYPRVLTHHFTKIQPEGVLQFDGIRFTASEEKQYLSTYFNNCLKPRNETTLIDAIIYQSVNNIDLDMNTIYCGHFQIVKRLRNSLNSLYIFTDAGL